MPFAPSATYANTSPKTTRRYEHRRVRHSARGFTYVETILTVAIVATVAAVAVPAMAPTRVPELRLARDSVVGALRFVRDEARRTGDIHGLTIDDDANELRVFRLDEAAEPDTRLYDVRHPVTKHLYTVAFGRAPTVGTSLEAVATVSSGSCATPEHLVFDPVGVVRCADTLATRHTTTVVTLSGGDHTLTVLIDGFTGRITAQ